MTHEATTFVLVERADWDARFAAVAAEAHRCRLRAEKAEPGDRREVGRYDGACATLEDMARRMLDSGAASVEFEPDELAGHRHPWIVPGDGRAGGLAREVIAWLGAGNVAFEIRDPFRPGPTELQRAGDPIGPDEVWRPPSGERGLSAVAVRWEGQLASARDGSGSPIVPSGVSNRVLTEGLRRFVAADGDRAPVHARVVYRDGSEPPAGFPLGALRFGEKVPEEWPALQAELISLRHPEMDPLVDLAWFRNRDVSVVRPAAETEALAYEATRRQLRDLSARGPVTIYMHQTGLEPAVVGFYRGLVDHLCEAPGSVAVVPRYFVAGGAFEEGVPWLTG